LSWKPLTTKGKFYKEHTAKNKKIMKNKERKEKNKLDKNLKILDYMIGSNGS